MKATGTLRLVDKKTRVVEILGPQFSDRRPRLLYYHYGNPKPFEVPSFCFKARDRVARFVIDKSSVCDELLAKLDKYEQKARPVTNYGIDGWTIEL